MVKCQIFVAPCGGILSEWLLTDFLLFLWAKSHHHFLEELYTLAKLSFQSNRLLFLHASEERGRKWAGKKVCLNRVSNPQPPGHE